MTTLDLSIPGELRLTLRGAAEDTILTTLRRWPHWLRADVEHDPVNAAQCLSVTLITDRDQEATLREILRRSFGMTFPPEGGDFTMPPAPPPKPQRRGLSVRRRP
ncbi:hypothetical protein EKD04_013630 [Chloroflexales bacterium ZM16-3]|nr:hypothetical protein [Chloroflexales bacterium ZM16-3]